jgi:ATP-dependent helicase/nuclease subunit B
LPPWSGRSCDRARVPAAGLAHAFTTFRAELAKLRNGEASQIHHAEPRAKLHDDALARAGALIDRIAAALAPLESMATAGEQNFADLAARHRVAVVQMSMDGDGMPAAFAGGTAQRKWHSPTSPRMPGAHGRPGDYASCSASPSASRRAPARRGQPHPHLRSLSARLTGVDRFVIGGLVEGVAARSAPILLNRPMRHALGLDLPERRIGCRL